MMLFIIITALIIGAAGLGLRGGRGASPGGALSAADRAGRRRAGWRGGCKQRRWLNIYIQQITTEHNNNKHNEHINKPNNTKQTDGEAAAASEGASLAALRGYARARGEAVGAAWTEEFRGSHLSTTTCLTRVFFKSGESCSKFN